MCQPGPVIIAHFTGEDLCLVGEPTIGGTVKDSIPVSLIRPSIIVIWLRMLAPQRIPAMHREWSQQQLLSFEVSLK